MFAKASGNQAEVEKLKRIFQIEVDANFNIAPKLVPFNYETILKPKSVREIKELIGSGVDVPSWQKGGGMTPGDMPHGADDSVPF